MKDTIKEHANDSIKDALDWISVGGATGTAYGITFAEIEEGLKIASLVAAIAYSCIKIYFMFRDRKKKKK